MQPGAKSFAISYFDQLDLTQGFSKNPQAFQLYLAPVTRFLNFPTHLSQLISFRPTHFVHRERKIRLLSCSLVRVVRGRSRNCFNILKVCGVKNWRHFNSAEKNSSNVPYNIKILRDFLVETNFFEFCSNKKKITNQKVSRMFHIF